MERDVREETAPPTGSQAQLWLQAVQFNALGGQLSSSWKAEGPLRFLDGAPQFCAPSPKSSELWAGPSLLFGHTARASQSRAVVPELGPILPFPNPKGHRKESRPQVRWCGAHRLPPWHLPFTKPLLQHRWALCFFRVRLSWKAEAETVARQPPTSPASLPLPQLFHCPPRAPPECPSGADAHIWAHQGLSLLFYPAKRHPN